MARSAAHALAPPDLDTIATRLVEDLGGIWNRSRRRGLCRCPAHADRTPSLSVRIGATALLFHCFAGCSNHEVIQALGRYRPSVLAKGGARPSRGANARDDADSAWMIARLQALWEEASEIAGTAAETYLRHRRIHLASDALRFHPRTPLGSGHALVFRPALLAAVREGKRLTGLQRTFLDIARGRRARDLRHPRRMFGRPGRGAVRLAPAGDILGLAEGAESALSAMILLRIPVWAALGAERLARVEVPLSVRRLVLLADNDRAGRLAADAALIAHAAPGRMIETLWPWHGLNDWNDVLRAGGKGVGNGRRHAA